MNKRGQEDRAGAVPGKLVQLQDGLDKQTTAGGAACSMSTQARRAQGAASTPVPEEAGGISSFCSLSLVSSKRLFRAA